ncbi:MAG: L,D-transpeptidase family protein, partial [Sphingomicrobium sp.]
MVERIVQGWSRKLAGRLVRPAGFAMVLGLSSLTMAPPLLAQAPAVTAFAAAASYKAPARPMWTAYGDPRAALSLIGLLETSKLDGLEPKRFKTRALKRALRSAEGGDPRDMARADTLLNRALFDYVAALRSFSSGEWNVVDRDARPAAPGATALLAEAAAAPSLEAWIEGMAFMHPDYAVLRRELAFADDRGDGRTEALLALNLKRARLLPGGNSRFVMVNAAAQRLYIYEGGRVVDSMKVVVGKPAQPTPMMAALIRFTAVRPYWNLPSDLVAERIAPNVIKDGLPYLKEKGYVVLSDWGDKAKVVDPATIDWNAVAAGTVELRVRQNPGPANAMGQMKFMFPNKQGIYLHDTPNKELLAEDARLFSAGCVRLEDAPRLAKWLYGKPLKVTKGGKPEQR